MRYCIDCGKTLVSKIADRCRYCTSIYTWTNPETRIKASESARKAAQSNPSLRKFRSDMAKKTNTPELRTKKREIAKRMWSDPITRQKMVDGIAASENKGNNKPSRLELRVGLCLSELGLVYTPQFRPKGFPRYYDFLLPNLNLLIEVDGEYWHHSARAICNGVEFADEEKNRWAFNNGYNLIRLRECYLKDYGIKPMIESALNRLVICEKHPIVLIFRDGKERPML